MIPPASIARTGLGRRRLAALSAAGAMTLRAAAGTAQPASSEIIRPPPGFLGANVLWPPGDAVILFDRFSRVRKLGLTNVRTDWEWRVAERHQGVYDWSALDRLVQVAHQAGISLLPIVHYAPDWALVRGEKADGVYELAPADTAFEAFGRFLVACVRRYGPGGDAPVPFTPIEHWQIWNEPNNKSFWGPAAEPASFVAMMRRVSTALAPYRDRIKIVHAGLSKSDLAFMWQIWDVDRQYGDTFDIMAVHPYIFDWWQGVRKPDDMDDDIAEDAKLGFIGDKYKPNYLGKVFNVQLFMTLRGAPGKPIWLTEMGFFVGSTRLGVTEQRQASLLADTVDYIVRRLTDRPFGDGKRALAANVQRLYWFALDDYGDTSFGLYRPDDTLRPSGETMRSLTR
jgi:hypothetical protein